MVASAFPRPVRCLAGRQAELERLLEHLGRDTLFLIYGIAGIGKSELVYQLVQEAQARPRWSEASALLVEVRAGSSASRVLAEVLSMLGARAPRRGRATPREHLGEQLEHLARKLDASPYLLFIDDVHHLAPDEVGQALGYLARHVHRSRIVVASRREIPIARGAPPPIVTTLGPLDATAAAQMAAALADRLQVARPTAEEVMRSSHGSPFQIHRMLARPRGKSTLEDAIAELSPPARRVLLLAAVVQQRFATDTVRAAWDAGPWLDEALRELEQRFLLDAPRRALVVHDLVREALVREASADELAAAHQDAADLCLALLRGGDGVPPLLAVDAVGHFLAAGRVLDAWAAVERWHPPLAAVGSEHLLLDPLERLRDLLPERRVAIDLLIAWCMVRASLIGDATRVLARIGERPRGELEARYCLLAGEVAQRTGDLVHATASFERAVDAAPTPDLRFQARLQGASAAQLSGDGERARRVLALALSELPAPTPRQRARAAWALAATLSLDERFERAADESRRARRELIGTGLDDLASRLAMLETLACIELGELDSARAAAKQIEATSLRRHVATLYRAIARFADGEPRAASVTLLELHATLTARGDFFNANLAGYYGSAALAQIGRLADAQALAARTSALLLDAGYRSMAARSRAQQALFAAEALSASDAHRLADEALSTRQIGPRSRATAHRAHAHAFTIEGELARARDHVEQAARAVSEPDLAAARSALDIERSAVELVGGSLDLAIEQGERVTTRPGGRPQGYDAARASAILAAAHLARGRPTDQLFAEQLTTRARQLAHAGDFLSIRVACAILSAAAARRGDPSRAAEPLLTEALRDLDPERGSVYAGALLAAIDGGLAARAAPGVVALLARLGLTEPAACYLVDQQGRRAASPAEVARERSLHDLFVDTTRDVIVARHGDHEIRGRPLQSTLLSLLVLARGEPVPAEALYCRAWRARAYHPLRHRNALYVAINRLRASLRGALAGREVIERSNGGWCLAEGIDACVAVPIDHPGEVAPQRPTREGAER
ncbi:MAG: AAA family ATPase [Polyangiaceae bacterium]|nr:AAA family ATPase [Polyangiaceae bacterium]